MITNYLHTTQHHTQAHKKTVAHYLQGTPGATYYLSVCLSVSVCLCVSVAIGQYLAPWTRLTIGYLLIPDTFCSLRLSITVHRTYIPHFRTAYIQFKSTYLVPHISTKH